MSYIIVFVIIQHVLHVVYQQIWETTVSPKNLGYVICDSLPFFVVSTEIISQTISRTLLSVFQNTPTMAIDLVWDFLLHQDIAPCILFEWIQIAGRLLIPK